MAGTLKVEVIRGDSGNSKMAGLWYLDKVLSDANTTLSASEYDALDITFTGTLTAGRDIVLPNQRGAFLHVFNNTTGGYSLTFKVSGQSGTAVAAGKCAILRCNGTDWKRVTADTTP